MYLVVNNFYGWGMSQKLPVKSFKWKTNMSIFDEEFTRNYDEDSDKRYILKVTIDYERMEINKCNKLMCNLYDKKSMLFM